MSAVLTPELLGSLKPAKVLTEHIEPGSSFTSLDFDDKGEFLITSATDEAMQLYNCRTGKHHKHFYSKKYGVHLARFTHKSTAIIHASTKEDGTLPQHREPAHTAQMESDISPCTTIIISATSRDTRNGAATLRSAHSDAMHSVVALEMSPQDDTFLSGATDDTVRLWDLRSASCAALLNLSGAPSVAYDPAGVVFAVALNIRSTILMYDHRKLENRPFLAVQIDDPKLARGETEQRIPVYTSLKFSNDGKYLLLGTGSDVAYVLDAFDGSMVARLERTSLGSSNPKLNGGQCRKGTFSDWSAKSSGLTNVPGSHPPVSRADSSAGLPTGATSFPVRPAPLRATDEPAGAIDGRLHIWDVIPPDNTLDASHPLRTLHPIKSINGHVGGPSRTVAFNPKSALVVSGGFELVRARRTGDRADGLATGILAAGTRSLSSAGCYLRICNASVHCTASLAIESTPDVKLGNSPS